MAKIKMAPSVAIVETLVAEGVNHVIGFVGVVVAQNEPGMTNMVTLAAAANMAHTAACRSLPP